MKNNCAKFEEDLSIEAEDVIQTCFVTTANDSAMCAGDITKVSMITSGF